MSGYGIELLTKAIGDASILRLIVKLRPAAVDGLVYPPTYPDGPHLMRDAWVAGEARPAVVLDSVQSQSNRVEAAILDAHRRGDIQYPNIELVVNAPRGEERYSVLQLSHRVYDAALRFTNLADGSPFIDSKLAQAIYSARAERASALFEHAPMTLALGGWDSHGGGGPLVAKLPRLLTSEIVGLDAKPVRRGAVKFDPMDIRSAAGPLYASKDRKRQYEVDTKLAADKKGLRPSEAGLGSVPSMEDRGVVITSAVQTSLVSLAAVRRLRFEDGKSEYTDARDAAGRAAIVALALYGLLAQMESGYWLRSGCDLIPEAAPTLEIIRRTLDDSSSVTIDAASARAAFIECLGLAVKAGFAWRTETIRLLADERLTTLVRQSREATAAKE